MRFLQERYALADVTVSANQYIEAIMFDVAKDSVDEALDGVAVLSDSGWPRSF